MKTCCNCNISKEDSEFYKDSHSKDGLTSKCKECQKEYQRKRYQENRDEIYDYTPIEPKVHVCEQCGEDFKSKHNPKYCSDSCKWKAGYERNGYTKYTITCINCGEEAEVAQKDGKYCSTDCFYEHTDYSHFKRIYEYDAECITCGKDFVSNSAHAKYCSDDCRPPRRAPRCSVYFNECKVCNKTFAANMESTAACSQSCSNKLTYYRAHGGIKTRENICKECGIQFITEYVKGDGERDYCSSSCFNKVRKRNRKYRKRNNGLYEDLNRTKIFERDKWKCQDCGTKTPRELMGKGLDNSPTLDHIVPLSLGGPHTYGNVQLLCRSCNSIKSNNYEGQTVLL